MADHQRFASWSSGVEEAFCGINRQNSNGEPHCTAADISGKVVAEVSVRPCHSSTAVACPVAASSNLFHSSWPLWLCNTSYKPGINLHDWTCRPSSCDVTRALRAPEGAHQLCGCSWGSIHRSKTPQAPHQLYTQALIQPLSLCALSARYAYIVPYGLCIL